MFYLQQATADRSSAPRLFSPAWIPIVTLSKEQLGFGAGAVPAAPTAPQAGHSHPLPSAPASAQDSSILTLLPLQHPPLKLLF